MLGFSYLCNMRLYIFNPEHDLALAANIDNYTAPHAGRQLRRDLGFIPALWANEGDFVLVEDIDDAYDKVRHLGAIYNKVEFVTPLQLSEIFKNTMLIDSIHPWGWDKSLVYQLKSIGCPEIMLPTPGTLSKMRELSGRRWAAEHLQENVDFVADVEALKVAVADKGKAVIKAPWSSSGRGVRYITLSSDDQVKNHALVGGSDVDAIYRWADNVIKQQGGVTVEPYYNKVMDFGMEFEVNDGKVEYRGLSLFDTIKAAYTGNVLATETEKEELMAPYISAGKLQEIREQLMSKLEPVLHQVYNGPFGVDMMIYSDGAGKLCVNPCVELNLRRTMGHVALDFGLSDKVSRHLMQIDFDGKHYRLRVLPGKPSENAPMH